MCGSPRKICGGKPSHTAMPFQCASRLPIVSVQRPLRVGTRYVVAPPDTTRLGAPTAHRSLHVRKRIHPRPNDVAADATGGLLVIGTGGVIPASILSRPIAAAGSCGSTITSGSGSWGVLKREGEGDGVLRGEYCLVAHPASATIKAELEPIVLKCRFTRSTLDKIAEVLQFDGEVDVTHHHFLRHNEHDGREVQNAGDACVHQSVCDFLRGLGGHRDDCHFHVLLANDLGQLVDSEYANREFSVAEPLHVHVECSPNFEPFLLKAAIGKQSRAEISDADEHDRLQAARAQQVCDHARELLDIVAQSAGSKLPEVSEVFAKLRGFHTRDLRERFARDRANVIGLQSLQAPKINRQTINRFAGYFRTVRPFQARDNYCKAAARASAAQSTNINSFESSRACA